jgi:predicted alpha/beta hydrolase family esterase
MTETILILPGWHGSGDAHWQRWLVTELPGAKVVEQADWAHPDLDAWLRNLEGAIRDASGPVILIAHSLGVILAAHHAARHGGELVAGALLVAPGDADVHAATEPDIAGFAPVPRHRLPYPSILVASRNDPYMDFGRSAALARDLGSDFVDLGDAGHVNVASGYGPWLRALDLLAELRATISQPAH